MINDGTLTVALDTEITAALLYEGCIRDLVRTVQNMRKEKGLAVTDKIRLSVSGNPELKAAFDAQKDYLCAETLATAAAWVEAIPDADAPFTVESAAGTWAAAIEKA